MEIIDWRPDGIDVGVDMPALAITLSFNSRLEIASRSHYSSNMTLDLKIRRVGNSLGVIIPTEALALLNVKEGDHLYLTEAAEGSVRLSAHRPGFAEKAAIADDLIQRYRNALNELAK